MLEKAVEIMEAGQYVFVIAAVVGLKSQSPPPWLNARFPATSEPVNVRAPPWW